MEIDDEMEDIFGTWLTHESDTHSPSDDEEYSVSYEESSEQNSEDLQELTLF